MQEQIDDFITAMTNEGCPPTDPSCIIADDEIHRYHVHGDKSKNTNAAYRLSIDLDGFAFGWFRNYKDTDNISVPYHSKAKRDITPEERAAFKVKADESRKRSETKRKEAATQAADRASQAWESANQDGSTEYLTRKQIQLHGCRIAGDQLLVPMRRDGELVSMQYIHADGRKLFEKGGDQAGAYFSIAKNGDDLSTMAIVEGFSTGASIREATGWPVVVAFNAGGLKACALSISHRHPDARIVICGDNDHATTNAKGEPWNVGLEKAQQAAVAIGGAQVVVPETADGVTDWNDVHCKHGLDAVAAGVMVSVAAMEPDIEPDTVGPSEEDVDPLSVVRPLGHNRGMYYFFPKVGGQVLECSASALGQMTTLYRLAPRNFWYGIYDFEDKLSDRAIASLAADDLMGECHKKGIFALDDARGIGVWRDKGGFVVNCGDVLIAGGVECKPPEYVSKFVYEAGVKVIDLECDIMGDYDAGKLLKICRRLSWKKPIYADILAGWLVVAAIGSSLKWRPHITLTGQSGSGKSTVMDYIIKEVIGDLAVKGDGGSTEPGIRKALKGTGRPFLMDEAESESKTAKVKMDGVMELIRKASQGGNVLNAADNFTSNSCFCLSAINPNIHQKADLSRNTMVELHKDESSGFAEKWSQLSHDIRATFNASYSQRLFARTCANLDNIDKNIITFSAAAAAVIGDNRGGDQMGSLMAGAYSLKTTGLVSALEANRIVSELNLADAVAIDNMPDAEKLVMHIRAARVRFDSMGRGMESSIGELVSRANDIGDAEQKTADAALRGYGLKIEGDWLLIANTSPQMSKILRDTPWSVWRRTLGDYEGSGNYDNKPVSFGAGQISKVVSLPLTRVLGLEVTPSNTTPECSDVGEVIPFD